MSDDETQRIATKRLANKVIWNLEEIQAILLTLWEIDILEPWLDAVRRAELQHDAVMLRNLALMMERQQHLWKGLARIERKARDARQGEWKEDE